MVSQHLASFRTGCCLVPVPSDEHPALLSMLQHVRSDFPHAGVIAVFSPGRSSHQQLLQIGAIGVSDVLVVEGELSADYIRTRLGRAAAHSVANRIGNALADHLPDAWVTLFKVALRLAQRPVMLPDFAVAAGMHERTLRKHCSRAGLLSPQWVLGWARVLTAAYYLDEPGRTVVAVANLLGFPSPSALQNLLRRYTGVAPRTLRQDGTSAAVMTALFKAVSAHEADASRANVSARHPLSSASAEIAGS